MIAKYYHKRIWKLVLFAAAIVIGVASIVYTNYVVQKLAKEERERIQTIVEATKLITEIEANDQSLNFLMNIIKGNNTTPVIVTDTLGNITQYRNIDSVKALDTAYLYRSLNEMKATNDPVFLNSDYFPEIYHYGDSTTIILLKYYPYVQLFIIALFIIVSYLAFSSSRKFEQNQVWVGMSKETAHQLGTPLSSLMAWVEYFRGDERFPKEIVDEIDKDVHRLEVITERFSKVGSQPILTENDVLPIINSSIEYLQKRVSKQVKISVSEESDLKAVAFLNVSLFEWVIENLCKNAVDAMVGNGSIVFTILNKSDHVVLDVKDTGRGVPIYLQKTIFNPGYTTRKRGWGLGLSLAKRIIESYHNGQIFVASSEPGKGTTFRIKLQKRL